MAKWFTVIESLVHVHTHTHTPWSWHSIHVNSGFGVSSQPWFGSDWGNLPSYWTHDLITSLSWLFHSKINQPLGSLEDCSECFRDGPVLNTKTKRLFIKSTEPLGEEQLWSVIKERSLCGALNCNQIRFNFTLLGGVFGMRSKLVRLQLE